MLNLRPYTNFVLMLGNAVDRSSEPAPNSAVGTDRDRPQTYRSCLAVQKACALTHGKSGEALQVRPAAGAQLSLQKPYMSS